MKAHSPAHQHGNAHSILEFLPGPVKIKDGLFIGDEIAARDIEFVISNKVTHIINTVSRQVPNLWERFGIHYLSVNWTEKQQNIFDKKNNAVNAVYQFIEEALEQGESCLIHSLYGKSRASAVLIAYLMKKYSWSMDKTLEFIASKKQNLQIRNNYMKQLQELEAKMKEKQNLSTGWHEFNTEEEQVLINTLANSKSTKDKGSSAEEEKRISKKRVTFDEKPTVHKINALAKPSNSKETFSKIKNPAKSILKGDLNPPESEAEEFNEFEEEEKSNPRNIINNINANVVHLTVNNYIGSDKKQETPAKNSANTRPYSSDQKEREKEKKPPQPKKSLLNDPFGSSVRSPYDMKLGNKNASIKVAQKPKEANRFAPNQRPQSAKHRTPVRQPGRAKEQMIVTNSSSSYASSFQKRSLGNPREELFRRNL